MPKQPRWEVRPKGIPTVRKTIKGKDWWVRKPGTAPKPKAPTTNKPILPPREWVGSEGLQGSWKGQPRLAPDRFETTFDPQTNRWWARPRNELTGLDPQSRADVRSFDEWTKAQQGRISGSFEEFAKSQEANAAAGSAALQGLAGLMGTGYQAADPTGQVLGGAARSGSAAAATPIVADLARSPGVARASGLTTLEKFTSERGGQRKDLLSGIREAIAKAQTGAEEQAFNRKQLEATLAIAGGKQALSEKELELDAAERKAALTGQVPYGFVRLPDGSIVRDPTVPQAKAPSEGGGGSTDGAPSPARGEYPPNKLRKEGYVGGWKVKPAKGGPFTQATDGTWWRKKGGSSGGGTTSARRGVSELQKELVELYKPGDIGGWEERYDNNPKGAGVELARWVRENKRHFVQGPLAGRKVNVAKLRAVLQRIGGRPVAEALSILTRGYIDPQGRWE